MSAGGERKLLIMDYTNRSATVGSLQDDTNRLSNGLLLNPETSNLLKSGDLGVFVSLAGLVLQGAGNINLTFINNRLLRNLPSEGGGVVINDNGTNLRLVAEIAQAFNSRRLLTFGVDGPDDHSYIAHARRFLRWSPPRGFYYYLGGSDINEDTFRERTDHDTPGLHLIASSREV